MGCAHGISSIVHIFIGADEAELGIDTHHADEPGIDSGMGPSAASCTSRC